MDTFLDLLNDDCQLHLMKYLNTFDLMHLKKVSPRLAENVFYTWSHQKKIYIGGEIEKNTNFEDRTEFLNLISPRVEELTVHCLKAKHLRQLQQFNFPKVKTLYYLSMESMIFNDEQLSVFALIFPDLRILKLHCLTSARYIWEFPKLDELYCGMYMTPTENIFKKMFHDLSLSKFELVYNTQNLQLMHPMIKSIWHSRTLETICVDDWQLCCCALPRILYMPKLSKIEVYGGEYDGLIMNHLIQQRSDDVHTLLYHTVFRCQQFHHDAWLKMPNLKNLIFINDRMPTSTIRQLKTQLSLKEFHLVKSSRPAGGALIQLLGWNGLELINLSNTEVSYDYIIKFQEEIKNTLSTRTTPVTIHIHKTSLTKNQLNEVVDSHPMVKISTEPLNIFESKFKNFFHIEMVAWNSRNSD